MTMEDYEVQCLREENSADAAEANNPNPVLTQGMIDHVSKMIQMKINKLVCDPSNKDLKGIIFKSIYDQIETLVGYHQDIASAENYEEFAIATIPFILDEVFEV